MTDLLDRPKDRALRWANAARCNGAFLVMVSGGGDDGQHLQALLETLPDHAVLVVAEPFPENIPPEALANGKLIVFSTLDRAALMQKLEPHQSRIVAGVKFLWHSSADKNRKFHADFLKLFGEFVSYARTSWATCLTNSTVTARNIAQNLGRYAITPPIDAMRDFFKGVPAILVAAGPSLAKNFQLLHEAKGRCVIIAVQTMLKPLLAAGIPPDFVTSLDYHLISAKFFENLEQAGSIANTHLVAEPKVHASVPDMWRGSMSMLGNPFADALLGMESRATLKAGTTVAHLSFYLGEFLGCDPLIMVGQDLGFSDGLYYVPGTTVHENWEVELGRFNTLETMEWKRIAEARGRLRKIPDIHGHPMYTDEQFFSYLQQFERDFAATKCRVIDATEGGAMKQGVIMMTLRETLDTYLPGLPLPPDRPWKRPLSDELNRLELAAHALNERRYEVSQIAQLSKEMLQVLTTMKANLEKPMPFYDRINVLNDQMRPYQKTFDLITALIPRHVYRQSLFVLWGSRAEGLEQRKIEVTGNLDYVQGVAGACVTMEGILAEAQDRLARQIEAVREGRPWPVETLGGAK